MKTEQEIRERLRGYDVDLADDHREDGTSLGRDERYELAGRADELQWVLGEE